MRFIDEGEKEEKVLLGMINANMHSRCKNLRVLNSLERIKQMYHHENTHCN